MGVVVFKNRVDAGKKLAERLVPYRGQNCLVLALPRGGAVVGFEIARKLDLPLDVLAVRKLGAPVNPEFGIGAIAAGGVRVLDQEAIADLGISSKELDRIAKAAREELDRRAKEYRGTRAVPDIEGKTVILVDDGLATGLTARAAIKAVLGQNPKRLIVAMPVCALDATEGIRSIIRPRQDEMVCLTTPYDFSAVGLWYKSFDQVTDSEVVNLLERSARQVGRQKVSPAIH